MNVTANYPAGAPGEPTSTSVHRPTGASLIAVIGIAAASVGVTIMHAARSDVDPLRTVMSHYANGSRGPVMSVVFYAFGATAIALGFRLRSAIDRHGVTKAFPVLLWLAGASLIPPASSRSTVLSRRRRFRTRSTATQPWQRS